MAQDQRRLAAIVSADVVGYSRLMGRDESGTLAALKAHLRELIHPKIAEHKGRIVKTTGDGLLLEFSSVVDAVRCAVDVQRGMAERNTGMLSNQRIEFRIGINVGDIIIDGDDIFGDGVNIAARLQTLAEPGGICVSKVVRDQVLDKLSFAFEDLGTQAVKNIARPIEIFRVDFDNAGPRIGSGARSVWRRLSRLFHVRSLAVGVIALGLIGVAVWSLSYLIEKTPPTPAAPPLSIAILPFVTPEGAAERQLADTLARDLTSTFERSVRSARVTSPTLAATYRDKAIDARTVGRELGVRYLVEGEIRRVGEQLSVDVKIVDAGTATQTWSDRLQVEDSQMKHATETLASRLVARLADALWDAEIRRARAPPPPGASAMDVVMHAYAVWARDDNTLSGALEARKWFDRALQLDADCVPALTGRIRTVDFELDLNPHAERDRLEKEMDELAFRAVAIDPRSSAAWKWRADALSRQWRWDAALEAISKAEKLDPSDDWPLNQRAGIKILTGQPVAALALVDQQLARDPQTKESLGWAALQRCRAYMALGRYDDAVPACETQVALDDWWLSHVYLLAAYVQKADTAKTVAEKAALLKLRPGFSIADFKAQRFSDDPAFWQQTEKHVLAGLRRAGIPEA